MQRPSPSRILWICGLSSITPTPALSHFLQPPNLFSESLPQAKFFEASEAWRGSMWSRNYPSRRADPIESRPSSIGSMCFDHAKDADSCFPGRLDTETTGWTFQAVWLTWLWKKSGNPPLQTKKNSFLPYVSLGAAFPGRPDSPVQYSPSDWSQQNVQCSVVSRSLLEQKSRRISPHTKGH